VPFESPSVGKHEGLRRAGDAASFIFVAGIVFSETPGRACKPNWTKAAQVREALDLETAKESIVALHLKLGFKVVVEWTSPKKYGPMCSFYGVLARFDQNGLSAAKAGIEASNLTSPAAFGPVG
jgi:hypothetical protein